MAIPSFVPLSELSAAPLNPKSAHPPIDEATRAKAWPVFNDKASSQKIDPSQKIALSQTIDPAKAIPQESSCRQCQFCSHFQLELTHWGRCSALSVLVPSQASACILHEPYFSQQKTVVPLTQLQQPTTTKKTLNALKSKTPGSRQLKVAPTQPKPACAS